MATSTFPITVTDEAKEFIAGLGMQREFEQILEHVPKAVPDLRSIEVVLDDDPSGQIGPGIVIWAHRPDHMDENDKTDWNFGGWKVANFPPEVCTNFVMISFFE